MNKATLIYDGECSLCQGSKRWIEKRALAGQFDFIACQSVERQQRFPQIPTENCLAAIQLVLSDGKILSGADAIPEILLRLQGWQWLEKILRLQLFFRLSPFVYKWVARNRYFLSCVFPTDKK